MFNPTGINLQVQLPLALTIAPAVRKSHPMVLRPCKQHDRPKALHIQPASAAALTKVPTSHSQAAKHPEWEDAMTTEINALLDHGTWDLVPCSAHANIVDCRWVHKVKTHSNVSTECYKARLVAIGYTQQEGIN